MTAPVTAAALEQAALRYLSRYEASVDRVRRLLMDRLRRAGVDPADGGPLVEAVVEKLARAGLIDDRRYAEVKTGSLRRRGASNRAVAGRLHAEGIDRAIVAAVNDPVDERTAAFVHARRRRIGPYRQPAQRADRRNRDLAAMVRAGFSYDLAREVVDGDPV